MSAIQDYLEIFKQTVPHHLRAEAVAEVRSHLEELVHDLQLRGLSRIEAERNAIKQFGLPRKIGIAWRRAAGVVDWPDVVLAALPLLGVSGLSWYFVGQFMPLGIYLIIFGAGAAIAWWRDWPTWWYAWLGWLFLALLVVPVTPWAFVIIFPVLVTLIAVDSWEQATLMTLPFTTYLAFNTIIDSQQLFTTGWGPGNIYPGNIVWLETAFSLVWILILAASLRAARPSRRGIYLLAGLIGTQMMYVGGVIFMMSIAAALPTYFTTILTPQSVLFEKLPIGLLTIGLTLYPLCVWLIARWVRRSQTQSGLRA